MKCPFCGSPESKVIDSRPLDENNSIRRRRECLDCRQRYTTYEIVEEFHPVVVKKNGTKELFDKSKLLSGLMKACEKRPVDAAAIAKEIEAEIRNSLKQEVPSSLIGDMAMERLREADDVAYIRFASVHREFKDIDKFEEELTKLRSEKGAAAAK